jgi:antitoxin component YwqK of YwqJK toxin-antitoxin module|tara:strand:+ start:39 stop:572 length:534 start_codon:yes stop_codon:yes gene_type:complete
MGEQDKKHGYSAELVRLVEKDTTYEEEFYNNGKPKYLKTTKTGRDGIVITIDWKKIIKWYENGQKKYEGTYSGVDLNGTDMKEGLWTGWYENGQKEYEENWGRVGMRDGLYTHWYDNGQKWIEATFKKGKRDGLFTVWYANGQKKYEGNLKDGKLLYTTVTCDVNDWTCFELNFFKP